MFINYACSVLVASSEAKSQSTCLNRCNLTGIEHTINKACKIDVYVYNSLLYSVYVKPLRHAVVDNYFLTGPGSFIPSPNMRAFLWVIKPQNISSLSIISIVCFSDCNVMYR